MVDCFIAALVMGTAGAENVEEVEGEEVDCLLAAAVAVVGPAVGAPVWTLAGRV